MALAVARFLVAVLVFGSRDGVAKDGMGLRSGG